MMGYRDMKLTPRWSDGVSLRRVVGAEIEMFETLEIAQRMEEAGPGAIEADRPAISPGMAVRPHA